MSSLPPLEAAEWSRFSLPHVVRVAGEYQHLLGAGAISMATTLRLRVEVDEVPGAFALMFGSGELDPEKGLPRDDAPVAEFAVRWEDALGGVVVPDPALLDGLNIYVDCGSVWDVCPVEVLLTSPAVAVALAVAIVSHRAEERTFTPEQLTELACATRRAVEPAAPDQPERFYSEALLSIVGGAGYVEPGFPSENMSLEKNQLAILQVLQLLLAGLFLLLRPQTQLRRLRLEMKNRHLPDLCNVQKHPYAWKC